MMSTAFGKSGMVILHLVREVAPNLPIYFLNTGFHFAETLAYAEELRKKWNLNLILKLPKVHGDAFTKEYGERLYQVDPDLCCHKNKVEPFDEILQEHQGWITGVRRDQGQSRAQAEPLELLEGGMLKIQPLVTWKLEDVQKYVSEHDIPLHPLFADGFTSIGCEPCTKRPLVPGDERSGRWAGIAKKECGLHTFWAKQKETAEESQDTEEEESEDTPPKEDEDSEGGLQQGTGS
jgi:phosphoadenosine phosphosulfate reductase